MASATEQNEAKLGAALPAWEHAGAARPGCGVLAIEP
jgi:hypothetical protein